LSVALVKPTAIAKHEGIEQVEADLLNMPQVEPNIIHRFGPGIYIREMSVPAGTMFIGHAHKYPHTNILLAGSVVVQINGDMQTIHAPSIFVAAPGRKLAYVIADCVWQNIYATEETDIEKLEVMLVDKSETFTAHSSASADYKSQMVAADREDYQAVLREFGTVDDVIRAITEDTSDQIEMPPPWCAAVTRKTSEIAGEGLFANHRFARGRIIVPSRLSGKRTPSGRYVNHSKNPNCFFIKTDVGDIYLIAKKNVSGGEELTVDYRQAATVSDGVSL
jgi:quercetin dioxygenase-like cupin family protein